MLNDWGIHHLHLSTQMRQNGFVQSADLLLFAIFKHDAAYLIDIGQHGNWASHDIAVTILRNWPEAGLIFELHGMAASRQSYTDAERRKLRNAGIVSPIEIDGKAYMFAAGISTAGTSVNAVRAADQLLDRLEEFEKRLNADDEWLPAIMRDAGAEPSNKLRLRFTFLAHGYGVIEDNANFLFRLA